MNKRSSIILATGMILLLSHVPSMAGDAKKTVPAESKPPIAAQKAPSKAKIKFDSREFDFGTVEQGGKVTHVFNLSNTGTEPLVLDRVQTSCGCTAAVTSSKTILPNEKGTIETTFNSSRFHGQIHKTITVYSNDPTESVVRLTIRGNVVTDVVIVPREMFFGLIDHQKTATRNVLITQGGSTPLEIKKIESDLKFISTELMAGTKGDKKTYTVIVKVSDKAPLGRFEGKLKIHTNLPKRPLIEQKVMGVVRKHEAAPPRPANNVDDINADIPPWVDSLPEDQAAPAKAGKKVPKKK